MVVSHELPCRPHVLAGFSFFQEPRLDFSLGLTNGDDSFLDSIEIVPTLLSQETQPNIQDGRPDPDPPVGRLEREGWKFTLRDYATKIG